MKKKIMAVLLAATMAIGMLAGCGGSKGGESYPGIQAAQTLLRAGLAGFAF